MDNSNSGESSCKKHSSDDSSSENSRPFKKAKFPWQVKGKFHLKDRDDTMEEETTQADDDRKKPDESASEEVEQSAEINDLLEDKDNLEMLSDYLLKQDCNILDTIFKPEINGERTNIFTEVSPTEQCSSSTYPKYTPSYDKVPSDNNNSDISDNLDVSMSSNDTTNSNTQSSYAKTRQKLLEDHYLKRWQARQIAKGYVDNTINRVLDSWFVSPLPPHHEDDGSHIPLDVTGLFDDLANNDGIENEGILMAISAHGLQNNHTSISRHIGTLQNRSYYPYRNFNVLGPRRLSESTINDLQTEHLNAFLDSPRLLVDELEGLPPRSSSSSTSTVNLSDDRNRNSKPPIVETGCLCTNTHRRASTVPNVPFHRRNNSEPISHSLSLLDSSDVMLEVPSGDRTSDQSETDESSNKKPSDESMEEDEDKTEERETAQETSTSQSNDGQFEEDFDFIDAAVSFAIQAKGLIPF